MVNHKRTPKNVLVRATLRLVGRILVTTHFYKVIYGKRMFGRVGFVYICYYSNYSPSEGAVCCSVHISILNFSNYFSPATSTPPPPADQVELIGDVPQQEQLINAVAENEYNLNQVAGRPNDNHWQLPQQLADYYNLNSREYVAPAQLREQILSFYPTPSTLTQFTIWTNTCAQFCAKRTIMYR